MMARMRWLLPLAALLTLGIQAEFLPGSPPALHPLERTFKVNGPVDLRVKTRSEDLTVRRGEDGTVSIKCIVMFRNGDDDIGESGNGSPLAEADLRIHQDGNQISIDPIEDSGRIRGLNVRYEVALPANSRLSYEAGSGDLSVDGIRGPVEYTSGSGDVQVRSSRESIRIHTGTGDVNMEDVGDGEIEVETHTGDVHVSMSSGAGYDLTAHTGTGDISVAHEITVEAGDTKNEVRGKVHGGGRPVKIQTGTGDIRVE
jgi:DUF4097 and DUF4098 domain-containing protein YvlB